VLSPMPLLAPVITTTLSAMLDISIPFLLLKNLSLVPGCAPLKDGPSDFRNLLDQ